MRYMWGCNKWLSPKYVSECVDNYADAGCVTVIRGLTFSGRVGWALVGNLVAFKWARDNNLIAEDLDYWSITSCNKQYVKNEVTGKYVGALGEVDLFEAREWVQKDEKNWYLTDGDTDQIWIPLQRNPNKMIPTGAPGYCRHCGNTSAQTPGNRYHPVYRPWPLHVDA